MMTPKALAIFDFDETLIEDDCLILFLKEYKGIFYTFLTLGFSVFTGLVKHFLGFGKGVDWKGNIKAEWLFLLFKNKDKSLFASAIQRTKSKITWKEDIYQKLMDHKEKGHKILIATGALDIFIYDILDQKIPYDAVLATQMEERNGCLTGRIQNQNCVRKAKAASVQNFIDKHGPFDLITAYGNLPSDKEMLDLAHTAIVVPKKYPL